MNTKSECVWVVDDEPEVVAALAFLLRSARYTVVQCQSGADLLERLDDERVGCILLDLRMPEMDGFAVQRELARRGSRQPVVFLSGHGDIQIAMQAVQGGAIDFLEKPVHDAQLFAAVDRALEEDRLRCADQNAQREAKGLLESLSAREAQVANLMVAGLTTREIAERFDLSPRTVEMHRARLLRRLGARNAVDAVRILKEARHLVDDRSTSH